MNIRPQKNIIKKQSFIRFAFDEAEGQGDLVATVRSLDRLRAEYGFVGIAEAIYPDPVASKIEGLFNLSEGALAGDVLEDKINKIRFIKLRYFIEAAKKQRVQATTFGLTGAMWETSSQYWQNPFQASNSSFPQLLHVAVFMQISPWIENMYQSSVTSLNKRLVISNTNTYFILPNKTLTAAKDFLANTPVGQKQLQQKPALTTFISHIENKKINVVPVYGWTVTNKYNIAYSRDYSPGNILQIIAGSRYAQLNGASSLREKPLVIAVYYAYQEEFQLINNFLQQGYANLMQNVTELNAYQTLKTLGLTDKNVLRFADIAHIDTAAVIDSLQKNQVLLLAMGSLPKIVFEGLYTHTGNNMLPAIREGQGSFYSLLNGKPHFRCGNTFSGPLRWELGYDAHFNNTELKNTLHAFYEPDYSNRNHSVFCQGMSSWQVGSVVYQTLGQLMIAAQEPTSAFSTYFKTLYDQAQQPAHDRLFQVLEKAIELAPSQPLNYSLPEDDLFPAYSGSSSNLATNQNDLSSYLMLVSWLVILMLIISYARKHANARFPFFGSEDNKEVARKEASIHLTEVKLSR